MKLAFTADIHLGNHRRFGGEMTSGLNRRFAATVDVLARSVALAAKHSADAFCVLGDLFDTSKPTPQELAAVMELFDEWNPRMQFHLLLGNHDQVSDGEGDHALAPLGYLSNVTVHEKPEMIGNVLALPFRVGAAQDWLPEAVYRASLDANPEAVLVHLGIADESTPPYLRGASDSITTDQLFAVMGKHGIGNAFAGNWHQHRSWSQEGRNITQCGALVPTGFDNPGIDGYGKLIIYEAGKPPTVVPVVGGPRFVTGVYEEIDLADLQASADLGHAVYARFHARPKHVKEAQAALRALQDRGTLVAFEVLPDREAVSATAKMTARMTRNATTVDEAVATYVAKTQMPEGAKREHVLALVQQYLARSV